MPNEPLPKSNNHSIPFSTKELNFLNCVKQAILYFVNLFQSISLRSISDRLHIPLSEQFSAD
jgi:hypothetical protein